VFVTAALRGAVLPDKPKVTLTDSWRHTGPINTALSAHWLTLTRHTEKKRERKTYINYSIAGRSMILLENESC